MANYSVNWKGKLLQSRYCLDKTIARGNYSRIFLARDVVFDNRKYVIKQLPLNLIPVDAKHTIKLMFQREAKILQILTNKHPQICQFYDFFADSSCLYLVLEWVQGITLEQKLHLAKLSLNERSRFRMSESETKNLLLNLLSVLDCIHNLGIIHRDLQPNNIIFRFRDNLPVLIDFGNATVVKDFDRHKYTVEQAVADSDLYSLGLMAIYLLTGRSPQEANFNLDSPDNFWHQAKTTLDSNLVRVIDRAIAPYPRRRFASATEMRRALQASNKTRSFNLTTTTSLAAHTLQKAYSSTDNSSTNNSSRQRLGKLCLIISLEVILLWLGMRYLISIPDYQPPLDYSDLLQVESSIPLPSYENAKLTALETTNKDLKASIFSPGTLENEIFQALGEPSSRQPGFWADSIAWSYQDVVMPEIDLGYILDRNTSQLHQAEIAVPASTDFSTVQSALQALVAESTLSAALVSGLRDVYQGQKTVYDFTVRDLEGTIQRNDKDRIYIGVWQADFH